jgi:hypothetical protein
MLQEARGRIADTYPPPSKGYPPKLGLPRVARFHAYLPGLS